MTILHHQVYSAVSLYSAVTFSRLNVSESTARVGIAVEGGWGGGVQPTQFMSTDVHF